MNLIAGIAFLVGVCSLQQTTSLPAGPYLIGFFCLGLVLLTLKATLYWCLGFLLLGFAWAGLQGQQHLSQRLPVNLQGQDIQVIGRVLDIPQIQDRRLRFVFNIEQVVDHPDLILGKTRLHWYNNYPQLNSGERWSMTVRLIRPHGFMNPAGFGYETWLYQQGISATGYVRKGPTQKLSPASLWQLDYLRASLSRRMSESGLSHAGVLAALSVGDRQAISQQHWQVFTRTGTNHLMAISGLHIGLVAAAAYQLGGLLWRILLLFMPQRLACCLTRQDCSAVCVLVFSLCYAALAGFSLPTIRALIMLLVFMGARLLRLNLSWSAGLSTALIVLLLFDSRSVLSPGFWLSFGAVAWIAYLLLGRLGRRSKWLQFVHLQWGLSLALLPLTLFIFQRAALSSLPANLVAVPLVSFWVVPLNLLGIIWDVLLPGWSNPLLFLANWGVGCLLAYLQLLSGQSWLSLQTSVLPHTLLFLLVALLLGLAPRAVPLRYLSVLLCLPLMFSRYERPPSQTAEFVLLDVGQGLAALVLTEKHTLVYDTGAKFSANFDAAKSVIVPYLRSRGISSIDVLIVSHGDNDHSGGYPSLAQEINIKRLLTSVPDQLGHGDLCRNGQRWRWDGVEFAILHPQHEHWQGNNASCVLKVSAGGQSLLIPGDIEEVAERALLNTDVDLRADVLLAPHHGSKSSSSDAFIAAVQPSLLLYAAGYRNRYGLPADKIIRRYAALGVDQYHSAYSGALSLNLGGGAELSPKEFRKRVRRYWHNQVELEIPEDMD